MEKAMDAVMENNGITSLTAVRCRGTLIHPSQLHPRLEACK